MKKNMALLLLTAVIFLFGCNNVLDEIATNPLRQFSDEPINITWHDNGEAGVQSFQANVYVYSKNNRTDTHANFRNMYTLSSSTIDNRILTRIDFDNMLYSSVISDGEEAVVFDRVTEEISHRLPIGDANSPLNRIFGNQSTMSRVNLSLIRAEASRLSLSMREETVGNINQLVIDIPFGMLPQNDLDSIISSRATFDTTNELLLETEMVMIREDLTTVRTTAIPIYEELSYTDADTNTIPIRIGTITIIDSKAPSLIEGFERNRAIINSFDDIPYINEDDFEELLATNSIHELPSITFGDPADLSFIETIYEVYKDIEINLDQEFLFRIINK